MCPLGDGSEVGGHKKLRAWLSSVWLGSIVWGSIFPSMFFFLLVIPAAATSVIELLCCSRPCSLFWGRSRVYHNHSHCRVNFFLLLLAFCSQGIFTAGSVGPRCSRHL